MSTKSEVINSAVSYAKSIAADNSHGYSQSWRWPEQGTSFDCSSLVITCYQQAGIPLRANGASYTGNMASALAKCSFSEISSGVNLVNGSGLESGDILLNTASHTAIYVGNGRLVHARSSEGTANQTDDSGNEIREQGYFNYPWNQVWRYSPSESTSTVVTSTTTTTAQTFVQAITSNQTTTASTTGTYVGRIVLMTFRQLNTGSKGDQVKAVQKILNYDGFKVSVDGSYGPLTKAAVQSWQSKNGLTADGIAGPATLKKMFGGT